MQTTTRYIEDVRADNARVMGELLDQAFRNVPGKHSFVVDERRMMVRIEVRTDYKFDDRICKEFYQAIEDAQEVYQRYEEWRMFNRLYAAFGSSD